VDQFQNFRINLGRRNDAGLVQIGTVTDLLMSPNRWPMRLPAPGTMSGDELIGNVIQVIADDLRLRPNPQNVVADPPD
jgi:hypothetical protein